MNVQQVTDRHKGVASGFHFLRHALALVILVFHCYALSSGGRWNAGYAKGTPFTTGHLSQSQLVVEILRPGLFALVGAFFALSGFLVTGSAVRSRNVRVFFSLRALRILPALSTEVMLSALLLGPVLTTLPLVAYFSHPLFFRYFGNVVGHVSYLLPGVYGQDMHDGKINANLWTLRPEFYCYLFMLAMMAAGIVYRRWVGTVLMAVIIATCLLASLPFAAGFATRYDTTHFTTWFIIMMFGVGVLFALNMDRIRVSPLLFVGSAGLYFVLMYWGGLDVIASLPLTYCTIFLGMQRFSWFDRLVKDDLSYGIYLYGYPITQVIIHVALPSTGLVDHVARLAFVLATAVPLTIAFSVWSWRVIEKPALGLRKRILPMKKPAAEVFSAAA